MVEQREPIPYPLPSPPTLYHPSPTLTDLLENRPVAEVSLPDGHRAFLVTRHADVRRVLVDPVFSRADASTPDSARTELSDLANDSILGMDPPEHTRLRRLVAGAFTGRRVEQLRPRVIDLVDELLGAVQTLPRPVDLVECFSLPLPVRVICELLGVPADDRSQFHAWSDTVLTSWNSDPEGTRAAFDALSHYFADLIVVKRAEPTDDLMTALIAARDEQDRLSERELVTLCLGLLIAGHETTANQINMFVLTLLHHPDQLDRLREDPDGVPRAVEELMRFVQLGEGGASLPRVTRNAVELSGVPVPKGAAVLPVLSIANRDPSVFPEPDLLDLSRPDIPHLAFGAGVHHCLGAQLARLELQEALRGLLRWMPGLRVTVPDAALRFKTGMVVRSLEALPVTW